MVEQISRDSIDFLENDMIAIDGWLFDFSTVKFRETWTFYGTDRITIDDTLIELMCKVIKAWEYKGHPGQKSSYDDLFIPQIQYASGLFLFALQHVYLNKRFQLMVTSRFWFVVGWLAVTAFLLLYFLIDVLTSL